MKYALLSICLMAFFSLTSCDKGGSSYNSLSSGGSSGKVDYSRSETEIKEDLKTREQRSPLSYLSTDGTYRKNLFGETVMEGTISSDATLASFKDVELYVTGYSKTKSEIGTWKETVYEIIRPGRSKSFKIKMSLPKSVKTVNWEIHDAIALR